MTYQPAASVRRIAHAAGVLVWVLMASACNNAPLEGVAQSSPCPKSDASIWPATYTSDALPVGACRSDAKCSLTIVDPCPIAGHQGPWDGYECSCVNGAWSCTKTSPGSGYCPKELGTDAGQVTDATRDAAGLSPD